MKILASAIITLTAVTIFVFSMSSEVYKKADELISLTEKISPASSTADTDEITDLWFKYEDYITLTVNHSVCDQIELSIGELHFAVESGDDITISLRREYLLTLLRDMRHSATFSFDRVL